MIGLLYIVINFIFIKLQSRFIFGGDSAEYSTVARTWGIAHPPGYPLYSFLINIINRVVPFETTPWRITLLSSIPTLIAAYYVYKILSFLRLQKPIAFMVSILYILLFPVWQYALIPEVFALHMMFVTVITYLLLQFAKNSSKSVLLYISFLIGLCISNHHIFVLFIPGWIYLIKDKLQKIRGDKKLQIQMLLLVMLGASFYLYSIIVSFNNTLLDWENAKTVQGFFQLITRSSYGSFKAYSGSAANIANQLSDMISGLIFILLDFKPLGIIFVCLGIYVSKRYGKQFSQFLIVSLALHFVFLFYTNFVLTSSISEGMYERFLIPIYYILVLFLACGLDYFFKRYYLPIVNIIKNSSLKTVAQASYFLFIGVFVLLIAVQNYKTISFIAHEDAFEQFGKDLVNTVPHGGILTTQGDTTTFTVYYRIYGLQERKDLVFFQLGLMGKPNYISMIQKRYPGLNISSPLKNSADFEKFIDTNSKRGYYAEHEMSKGTWRPYGLLWKYYADNTAAASDSASLLADNKRFWEQMYVIPELSSEEKNIFHLNSVNEYYLTAYQNYAKLLVFMNKYDEAEVILKNIVNRYRKNDPHNAATYMNILVFQKKCSQARTIATKIGLTETVQRYPGFVKPALIFLQTCDPTNKSIPEYKKKLLEYEKEAKTDLNSF